MPVPLFHIPRLDPVQAHIVHSAFEMAAFFLGGWLWRRSRKGHSLLLDRSPDFPALVGCLLGAVTGSKLANWIQDPGPLIVHGMLRIPGQSMVGGLLGAWLGVELAKRLFGMRESTGDGFVQPMLWGLCVGRIGCFLAGLNEDTFGLPTNLPWGVDLGDGISRHPAPLYEILFAATLALVLRRWPTNAPIGLRFRICAAAYMAWRIGVEFLKPRPWDFMGFSGLQWICLAGLAWAATEIVITMKRPRHAAA